MMQVHLHRGHLVWACNVVLQLVAFFLNFVLGFFMGLVFYIYFSSISSDSR